MSGIEFGVSGFDLEVFAIYFELSGPGGLLVPLLVPWLVPMVDTMAGVMVGTMVGTHG